MAQTLTKGGIVGCGAVSATRPRAHGRGDRGVDEQSPDEERPAAA